MGLFTDAFSIPICGFFPIKNFNVKSVRTEGYYLFGTKILF